MLDFQHGFPPTLTQSTFFRNPHKSPPLWILLTFSIGRRNGMQRLRGTGLTTPVSPTVFFTLPQPLSYTRNMINWCPAHPPPKLPAAVATTLTYAPSVVAIPQNNRNNKIAPSVSLFPEKEERLFLSYDFVNGYTKECCDIPSRVWLYSFTQFCTHEY